MCTRRSKYNGQQHTAAFARAFRRETELAFDRNRKAIAFTGNRDDIEVFASAFPEHLTKHENVLRPFLPRYRETSERQNALTGARVRCSIQLLRNRTNVHPKRDPRATFQVEIVGLIRALGLHRPDQTPCGQPISVAEAQAVLELSRQPGISQSGLATLLRLEKSTVSRVASMLELRGWIERSRDKNDARILRLRLTAAGLRAAQNLAASREAKFSKVFEAIPPDQRNSVLRSLALLSEALNEE